MYKLRRYFPPDNRTGQPRRRAAGADGAPDDDVGEHVGRHPRRQGAVGILHDGGLDSWVIDFGSPDEVEGGMDRTLTDHIVALSEAIDTVKDATGQSVHLAGYSQGGMWAIRPRPTGAPRTSPASWRSARRWTPWPRCRWASRANLGAAAADFMADHVFSRIDIPGWLARTGFQMLDPLKTAKARVDFLRQLHDREALLPREQQRRFLDSRGLDRLVGSGDRPSCSSSSSPTTG